MLDMDRVGPWCEITNLLLVLPAPLSSLFHDNLFSDCTSFPLLLCRTPALGALLSTVLQGLPTLPRKEVPGMLSPSTA